MPLEASSYSLKGSILNIFFFWTVGSQHRYSSDDKYAGTFVLPTCNTQQKLLSVAHCAEKKNQQKPLLYYMWCKVYFNGPSLLIIL